LKEPKSCAPISVLKQSHPQPLLTKQKQKQSLIQKSIGGGGSSPTRRLPAKRTDRSRIMKAEAKGLVKSGSFGFWVLAGFLPRDCRREDIPCATVLPRGVFDLDSKRPKSVLTCIYGFPQRIDRAEWKGRARLHQI